MSNAAVFDLEIYQNTTFTQVFKYLDEGGAAIDLSSYTARMQARRDMDSDDVLIDLSTASSGILLNSLGEITIIVSSSISSSIVDRTMIYDFLLTDSTGATEKILEGAIKIRPTVTRP